MQREQPSADTSEKLLLQRDFLSSRDVRELHRSVDQQLVQEDVYEAVPRPGESRKIHDIIIIIIHELLLYVDGETSRNHIQ